MTAGAQKRAAVNTFLQLPSALRCSETKLHRLDLFEIFFNPRPPTGKVSTNRNRNGPDSSESHLETGTVNPVGRAFLMPGSKIKPGLKCICPPASSASMVSDLIEAAEVIRLFFEIRNARLIHGVPQCPEHSQKGGLASAVLTHQQRQWREAGGLLFPKAAKISQRDLVHETDSFDFSLFFRQARFPRWSVRRAHD